MDLLARLAMIEKRPPNPWRSVVAMFMLNGK